MKRIKFTALLILSAIILAMSAAAQNIVAYKYKPILDGVISPGEYYEESKFTLDKAYVAANGEQESGEMTDDMSADFYFAYTAEGLYIAMRAKGDPTYSPANCWDATWGDGGLESDAYWVDVMVPLEDGAPPVRCLIIWGIYPDGTLAPRLYGSLSEDATGIVQGKGVYNGEANEWVTEVFVPLNGFLDFPVDPNFSLSESSVFKMNYYVLDRSEAGDRVVTYKSLAPGVWGGDTGLETMTLSGVKPDFSFESVSAAQPAENSSAQPDQSLAADNGTASGSSPKTGDASVVFILISAIVSGAIILKIKQRK